MRIRGATDADLADLVDAARAMAMESEGKELDAATVRRGVAAGLAGNAEYFIAEEDAFVGALFITKEWSDWNAQWYWWIQGAYVVPEHRGNGVFKALYEAVQAAAGDDVHSIRLYVENENPARAVYARLGMRQLDYAVYGHQL